MKNNTKLSINELREEILTASEVLAFYINHANLLDMTEPIKDLLTEYPRSVLVKCGIPYSSFEILKDIKSDKAESHMEEVFLIEILHQFLSHGIIPSWENIEPLFYYELFGLDLPKEQSKLLLECINEN